MLFPYSYIEHNLNSLHSHIENLVLQVWCKAQGEFDVKQLDTQFQLIVESNETYLKDPLSKIYKLFTQLTDAEKEIIANGFKANNDIQGICNGTVQPYRYTDIDKINTDLSKELNSFFKNMYVHVLKLAEVKNRCGDLDKHYDEFMKKNAKGKCPFCGLADISSELVSTREAYDHYLPKDKYPFNSINFKNLVPCCDKCNSRYKLAIDPVFDKKNQKKRKAFYPFREETPKIDFKVNVISLDAFDPKQNKIDLAIVSNENQEEVDAWREVYGIDERYLEKCKSEDVKLWIAMVKDEGRNYESGTETPLQRDLRIRKMFPFIENNFLRIPFLESCKAAGLIK